MLSVEEKDGDGFAIFDGEGAHGGAEGAGFCLLNDLGFEGGHGAPGGFWNFSLLVKFRADVAAAKDVARNFFAYDGPVRADGLLEDGQGGGRFGEAGTFAGGEEEDLPEGFERQAGGELRGGGPGGLGRGLRGGGRVGAGAVVDARDGIQGDPGVRAVIPGPIIGVAIFFGGEVVVDLFQSEGALAFTAGFCEMDLHMHARFRIQPPTCGFDETRTGAGFQA